MTIYNNNYYVYTHNIAHKEDNEPRPLTSEVPGIIIIASITITVFVVTAIIFSAIGFLCRHLIVIQQHNQDKLTTPSSDIMQDTQQSHELELQTNVAYENVTMN